MAAQPKLHTLESTLALFLRTLEGKNRSRATIQAYQIDLNQFLDWLRETNVTIDAPADVARLDITEYLAFLSERGLSGVSRARKVAAIREYFRFAHLEELVSRSSVDGIDTPKIEKRCRNYLTPEEYHRLLSAAGGNPRDYWHPDDVSANRLARQ
jgi:site-specific recombinase XerD